MPRSIAVVTTSRAEYGLLYWLIKSIDEDPDLDLQLIVGGSHMSPEYGMTVNQIVGDGFDLAACVEFLLSSDSSVGVGKSLGVAVLSLVDVLDRLRPDCLVLLGDRYEIIAAALAATVHHIPIAHIHGGEVTVGAMDDAIRHAITKLSHLHFAATQNYRMRIIQMGEDPRRVFCFGAPGLDHLQYMHFLGASELEKRLDVSLNSPLILCTFHPVTNQREDLTECLPELLQALSQLDKATIVFSQPNSDESGRELERMIKEFVSQNTSTRYHFKTLGSQLYLSLMKLCDVVVGNSSSGIIEAPALGVPAVDIGTRQEGRERASSVFHASNFNEINACIQFALDRSSVSFEYLPYAEGHVSDQIKKTIKRSDLQGILSKQFHEITHENAICHA